MSDPSGHASSSNSNKKKSGDYHTPTRRQSHTTVSWVRKIEKEFHEREKEFDVRDKEFYDRARDVVKPLFRDMPPPAQMLPQTVDEFVRNGLTMDPREKRPIVGLPEEFNKFDSAETSTLLSILLDTNYTRLLRLMNQVHFRAMLREDRYYQLVDDPSLYSRSKCVQLPVFHNRVVLYLTAPGLLIYLKQTAALAIFSQVLSMGVLPRTNKMINRRANRQSTRRQSKADFNSVLDYERMKTHNMVPFFNVYAYQYATYVHCYEGDLLRFQLDYLAVKRDFQEALPFLMDMNWMPGGPSLLLYRHRYYQYMTPFLDWVDMMRYQLKTTPTISVTGFYDRLLQMGSEKVDIDDLRCLGHCMLEYIELRRINKENCPKLPACHGMYAGRMVFRNKDPKIHNTLSKVFSGTKGIIRPVLPHACSPLRRFLIHLNYYDRRRMTSLPQIITLVDYLLKQDFFSMHPLCRRSNIHYEPFVFQIYDFVWSKRRFHSKGKTYLREERWDAIKKDEESNAWYRRWDVFNSICLLFSILQNSIQRNTDESIIEHLIFLIIDVLRSSEYLECFMSYSFFDTYLGFLSAVNCVPNLSLHCFQRVLQTVPMHLCATLEASSVLDSFTPHFWQSTSGGEGRGAAASLDRHYKHTLSEISKILMTRPRKQSVRQAPESDQVEVMSGMSSVGSTGAVVIFCRNYDQMPPLSAEFEKETWSNDSLDAMRRIGEEQAHIVDFRQREIDHRYSQVFTVAYCMAVGRPAVLLNEHLTYKQCQILSMQPFTDDA